MRGIASGLIVALFVCAPPARAADVASLECMRVEIGSAYYARTDDLIFKSLTSGQLTPPDFPTDAIDKAAATCAARNRWSDDARSIARMVTIAGIIRDAVERVLPAEGVDLATVKQVYARMDEPTRRGLIGDADAKRTSSLALAKTLQATMVGLTPSRFSHIGLLSAVYAVGEFIQPEFAKA